MGPNSYRMDCVSPQLRILIPWEINPEADYRALCRMPEHRFRHSG